MKFISTRGQTDPVSFTDAVAIGLAPDGGLFLPESLPDISPRLAAWKNLSYAELCHEFLGLFATDVPDEVLEKLIHRSYATFTHPEIAPLRKIDDRLYVLELFHGPTLAFKDFALQLLGNLYGWQCEQSGQSINVLGATSGDTGAAAIHGLLGKPHTAIFILYPEGRVSPLQERQMTCTGAANVHAIALDGSFDDAQRLLKDIFANKSFAAEHALSAVNSINIARVLAQSVYYLYAWLRLPEAERLNVEFVVPTGNFGNVFAGWLSATTATRRPSPEIATKARSSSTHWVPSSTSCGTVRTTGRSAGAGPCANAAAKHIASIADLRSRGFCYPPRVRSQNPQGLFDLRRHFSVKTVGWPALVALGQAKGLRRQPAG